MRGVAGTSLAFIITLASAFGQLGERAFDASVDHPAIEYNTRPVSDPVAELNRKIQDGKIRLNFDSRQGYLRSVLQALSIPIESQIMVFSQTSVQAPRISPHNPRSLFFNDSVTAGWVRGGFLEFAALDSQQGVIFYRMAQTPAATPSFERGDNCLRCHVSYSSLDVPGMLLKSVFTSTSGQAMFQLGSYISDHRSPFPERWGGWYVTGKAATLRHMGNVTVSDPTSPANIASSLDLESLQGKFDTDAFLSPFSDIVALMVFNHQMHMTNLITRLGWETRVGSYEHRNNADAALNENANELVDYMLFVDEAPIEAKIRGTSGFSRKFEALGPYDSKKRSLREFDLERRLMRYPCSYMIYSPAFDGLPAEAKEAIYKRMWKILSGEERATKYSKLSLVDRQGIVEILRETKRGLPGYFTTVSR